LERKIPDSILEQLPALFHPPKYTIRYCASTEMRLEKLCASHRRISGFLFQDSG
jgi:hypothetical protein